MAQPAATCSLSWERLQGDHDYFCSVLKHLFERQGYQVEDVHVYQAPREEAARACAFVLRRGEPRCLGLGLRQDLVVTSDVVGRLQRALPTARAAAGLVVTTSFFSEGALQAARRLPIQLIDRHRLWELLAYI